MTNQRVDSNSFLFNLKKLFWILIFFALFISGCHLPSGTNLSSDFFDSTNEFKTPSVNLQFKLSLTEPIRESERLVLEIIDDVTGMPYNNKIVALKRDDDLTYQAAVKIPAGSIIKYRYSKMSDSLIPEEAPGGEQILYRIAYAKNNTLIQDVLQVWQGELFSGATGVLKGSIVNVGNNQPVSDILVSAGGKRTFTDVNGRYQINGLGTGVHNVVFYAVDGRFRAFQQGAEIAQGKITSANVELEEMPEVEVTFHVIPPNDALGAPIYLAGNIRQLGNTFVELPGGMSIKPKRMPILKPNTDGSMSITLKLYAETDLRYKFTLGDGYWNAEQKQNGGFRIRQLIIPNQDIIMDHTIETWRSPGVNPITFKINIPSNTSPLDNKYIQFKVDDWMEPIPLWPLGNDQYLFILFSPLEKSNNLSYRFCRNEDCIQALDGESLNYDRQISALADEQTVNVILDTWQNWYSFKRNETLIESYVPIKSSSFRKMIEFTPEMDPSWLALVPQNIGSIDQLGANTVIFSPSWFVKPNSPYIQPEFGKTPFSFELSNLILTSRSQGFQVGLFPQISPLGAIAEWWENPSENQLWQETIFSNYREFIISYANLSNQTNTSFLIIGGKSLLPAIIDRPVMNQEISQPQNLLEEQWVELIKELRSMYKGELYWATNANLHLDPLPSFIDLFDGIYISVDSPLAFGDQTGFDEIQSGFIELIDREIYEAYRSTGKPITLGFGYPAVEMGASGCALFGESCFNDGLFNANRLSAFTTDFDQQSLIYNAIFPVVASRDWISNVSIRGYEPVVSVHTASSSIGSKPSADVIRYWYTNMVP